MKVALIGFGQIGRGLADAIADGHAGEAELVDILVRGGRHRAASRHDALLRTDAGRIYDGAAQLVVEVAGHAAFAEHAERVLRSGKHLMSISVGALADPALLAALEAAARESGTRVYVPSGAIAGLDMIAAAALAPLDEVIHTIRKPPRAFAAEQLGGDAPSEPRLLFDGLARDGVGRYPENVNVAAAVSLAGIGFDRTRLRVYADPTVTRNTHEVDVAGHFGRLAIRVENEPSDNPKTGRIVALSVAKALRNLTAPVVIGL